MNGAESLDQIGERLAQEAWAKEGRNLVLQPEAYAKVLAQITRKGGVIVRRAFDRRLARIAADAPIIIRPKLPPTPKPRKKRS